MVKQISRRLYANQKAAAKLSGYFFIFLMGLSSCSVNTKNNWVKKDFKSYSIRTIAIFPFDNRNAQKFIAHYPEGPQLLYEAFESNLVSTGFTVTDRRRLDAILQEMELSQAGITDKEIQVGRILHADLVVTGTLTQYVQGAVKSPASLKLEHSRVGFNFKGVHVETGALLFTGSMFRNIKNPFMYTSPVQNLLNELVEEAVKELIQSGLHFGEATKDNG